MAASRCGRLSWALPHISQQTRGNQKLLSSLGYLSCRMVHVAAKHPHTSGDEVRLLCAAASVVALSIFADSRKPSSCYFETTPQGEVDRLKRWSRVFWNLPSGLLLSYSRPTQDEAVPKLRYHRWRKIAQDGARRRKMAQDGARWRKTAQMAQDGARWRKMAQMAKV
eukprot:Skav219628  [mRNA]  locus=scaffold628:212272:215904:- [translate_table: standard]